MKISDYLAGALSGALCTLCFVGTQQPTQPANAKSAPQTPPDVVLPRPAGRKVAATVTAYCPCAKCCGKYADGVTSTGRDAYKTRGVAVDPKIIPYGSQITIPGAGTFVADDTGGAMRQATKRGEVHIDLRFDDHQKALVWGRQHLDIIIMED